MVSVSEAAPRATAASGAGRWLSGALLASVALAALYPLLGPGTHRWALLAATAIAAAAIAVVDHRTFTLPNRYVGPLAAAGAVQVVATALFTTDVWAAAWPAIAAAVVFITYAVMGMAGWFGFGDAKFAAALALIVALYAGPLAIYLVPLAILTGAARRVIRGARARKSKLAHGPDIAAAAIGIILITQLLTS